MQAFLSEGISARTLNCKRVFVHYQFYDVLFVKKLIHQAQLLNLDNINFCNKE